MLTDGDITNPVLYVVRARAAYNLIYNNSSPDVVWDSG